MSAYDLAFDLANRPKHRSARVLSQHRQREGETLDNFLVRLAAADALRGRSREDEHELQEIIEEIEAWVSANPDSSEDLHEIVLAAELAKLPIERREQYWKELRDGTAGLLLPTGPFLKGLRATAIPAEGPSHATLIVHGTWAHVGKSPRWFQEGGDFFDYVRTNEAESSSVISFHWSGENTDDARLDAVVEFSRWVKNLQAEEISVIAHSHGVNVVVDATDTGLEYVRVVALSAPYRNGFSPEEPNRLGSLYNVQAERDFVVAFARGRREPRYQRPDTYAFIELEEVKGHSESHTQEVWERFMLGQRTGLWP